MAKQRHTSFGRRADQAPDSPVEVRPEKVRSPAAQRKYAYRQKLARRVAPMSQDVPSNVPIMSQDVPKDVPKPTSGMSHPMSQDVPLLSQVLADNQRLRGLIHSLEMRIGAMEAWAEQLEERFPRMRVAASPLQGTTTSVPASTQVRQARQWPGTWRQTPPGAQPGDTFTTTGGKPVTVPEIDAEGNPIP